MWALRRSGISVGRRIALLVVAEALLIGALVGQVLESMDRLSDDLEYARRFVLAPAEAIAAPMERAAEMKGELELDGQTASGVPTAELLRELDGIEVVFRQYVAEWRVADSVSPDARRFRRELVRLGAVGVVDDEREALEIVEKHIRQLRVLLPEVDRDEQRQRAIADLRELRRGLRLLLQTNVRYIAMFHAVHEQRALDTRTIFLGVGIAGLVLSIVLGLHVRRAIAPRMATMARKVRAFQETGEYERLADMGHDEIAVLANALDAGLGAIRDREHERERFISVAAHELKTPVTSIRGFVQVAMATPDDAVRHRALEVVRRQTDRLGRLVQDLLLAATVRQGQLAFRPEPVDARALIIEAFGEIEDDGKRLVLVDGEPVYILADEDLLGHALWQILSFAASVTPNDEKVVVRIARSGALVAIEVTVARMTIPYDELERSFLPFSSVQYEGGGLRYAVGLHLSREIARVHGGTLCAQREGADGATLRLELPG